MQVTFQWIADSPGWIWLDSHLDGGILQAQSFFFCTQQNHIAAAAVARLAGGTFQPLPPISCSIPTLLAGHALEGWLEVSLPAHIPIK